MTRILITYVLPLVLPALVWYLWHRFRPQRPGDPEARKGWAAAPWPQLSIAGVVLLALTLGSIALLVGGSPGEVYQPARVIDGEVVPGRHAGPPQGN